MITDAKVIYYIDTAIRANGDLLMREHNSMFMVSNFMEDQILRFYKVPKSDTDPQYVKFRFSSEIMERIGGSPALSRNMSHQNLSAVMQRL